MKQSFKIILLIILISGCRSQSEVGFYINEQWLPHHSLCFVTRINIRNDSTFEYYHQGDLFNYHEIGKYRKVDDRLYLSYEKKGKIIVGYDTIKQKLDFNPPVEVKTIEPILFDPGFRDNFPTELQMRKRKLFIIQNQKLTINPPERKLKLRKVKKNRWNSRNASFIEVISNQ